MKVCVSPTNFPTRDLIAMADLIEQGGAPFVPGSFRCAKCGFRLIQSNLNAQDGTITARDAPGDRCPNDGSPMWRVTYREELAEAYTEWEKQVDRAVEAEKVNETLADEITALRERVAELTYYLNVAVEDFDSNNGRCSNEAHWSNEARDILAQQGTGHGSSGGIGAAPDSCPYALRDTARLRAKERGSVRAWQVLFRGLHRLLRRISRKRIGRDPERRPSTQPGER